MNELSADLDHVLKHTRGLWEEIRGQRLFITGGTGFFGCWLLESLVWANDILGLNARAVVLTRNAGAFRSKAPHIAGHPCISFQSGDVRSYRFPSGSFSHIIHAATESSTNLGNEDPQSMFSTIVDGTRRTLEFARNCGARKLLLTSSGAVYGPQPPQLTHIPETYAGAPNVGDPRSAYGEGKRAAEMLSTLYGATDSVEIKIARCFAFVGPYLPLNGHFAIGNFIRDSLQKGPVVVKGDGTPLRSYLYAADLAVWLWTILLQGRTCYPYNVGSENALTISEIAHAVSEATKPPVPVRIEKALTPAKDPERYVPSTARAREELGLHERIGVAEAVTRTMDWCKSRLHHDRTL
jgi:nucleoside-diphosphate-sugar epimerase